MLLQKLESHNAWSSCLSKVTHQTIRDPTSFCSSMIISVRGVCRTSIVVWRIHLFIFMLPQLQGTLPPAPAPTIVTAIRVNSRSEAFLVCGDVLDNMAMLMTAQRPHRSVSFGREWRLRIKVFSLAHSAANLNVGLAGTSLDTSSLVL